MATNPEREVVGPVAELRRPGADGVGVLSLLAEPVAEAQVALADKQRGTGEGEVRQQVLEEQQPQQ
jgi:hypothetical protein